MEKEWRANRAREQETTGAGEEGGEGTPRKQEGWRKGHPSRCALRVHFNSPFQLVLALANEAKRKK